MKYIPECNSCASFGLNIVQCKPNYAVTTNRGNADEILRRTPQHALIDGQPVHIPNSYYALRTYEGRKTVYRSVGPTRPKQRACLVRRNADWPRVPLPLRRTPRWRMGAQASRSAGLEEEVAGAFRITG